MIVNGHIPVEKINGENPIKAEGRLIVIDGGRIVQQGKHSELMQQQGIYRTFVEDRQKAVSWKL